MTSACPHAELQDGVKELTTQLYVTYKNNTLQSRIVEDMCEFAEKLVYKLRQSDCIISTKSIITTSSGVTSNMVIKKLKVKNIKLTKVNYAKDLGTACTAGARRCSILIKIDKK